jgi:hypothetical protein
LFLCLILCLILCLSRCSYLVDMFLHMLVKDAATLEEYYADQLTHVTCVNMCLILHLSPGACLNLANSCQDVLGCKWITVAKNVENAIALEEICTIIPTMNGFTHVLHVIHANHEVVNNSFFVDIGLINVWVKLGILHCDQKLLVIMHVKF